MQAGKGEESTEEYGIILAASLADRTLRQNRAVGLVAHGSELAFVPPGRGKGHMWRILRSLATVRAGGTRHLFDVLSSIGQNLGQSTTVLVMATPSQGLLRRPPREPARGGSGGRRRTCQGVLCGRNGAPGYRSVPPSA